MPQPFFNSDYLNDDNHYVAWLDVMGSRTILTRSLRTAANFIFKLHIASLETPHGGIQLYPMNDGVFAVGNDLSAIRSWLAGSFECINLANMAVQPDQTKVFLARAAVAFGPVAEGRRLGNQASATLTNNPLVRDAILIGAPVVNAYLSERYASPFGIYVHESARTFAPSGQPWSFGSFMRYWTAGQKPPWVVDIEKCISDYLTWCGAHSNELEYKKESIDRHEILTTEFFDF